MQKSAIRAALAVLAVGLVASCTKSTGAETGDRIISVSATMGTLVVVKMNPAGALSACLYESSMRPGDTYQPRGCQELAHQ